MKTVQDILDYIARSWEQTIRFNPTDNDSLIGMPYRYTVPSPSGLFQEMYYWDTFYTNEGLLESGLFELARGNTLNLASLIPRFGKVLNGSRLWYTNRSQPPHLSMMAGRYYEYTNDKKFLEEIVPLLETEYQFWMTKRITPDGLNCYGSEASENDYYEMYKYVRTKRVKNIPELDHAKAIEFGRHMTAECETGWDFNRRFNFECGNYAPIDLNSLMYGFENDLSLFLQILGNAEKSIQFKTAAQKRKDLVQKLLWDPKKLVLTDYNFVTKSHSFIISGASFYALYLNIASDEQARLMQESLKVLEFGAGISASEKEEDPPFILQWAYPNCWSPVLYAAVKGFLNYGFDEDAYRIAYKYVDVIVKGFDKTGTLYEKYNVVDGSKEVVNEYAMPEMLGWTAGVFIALANLIKSSNNLEESEYSLAK